MTSESQVPLNQISFTIVVPTHNGRLSVVDAVRSILGQTFKDFELIVVSDGDAIRTKELLCSITDPRLQILEQPKMGVSAARNRGVKAGHSEWVTFLDDDDTLRQDCLSHWSSQIESDVAAVTGRLAFWTNGRQTHYWDCTLSLKDEGMEASRILPGGFVIRRDAFDAIQGFDEGLAYSENQDLGLRLLDWIQRNNRQLRILNTDRVVADFDREHSRTRSRRYKRAPADTARVFLTRYARRLEKDKASAASLHRIIARAERLDGHVAAARRSALTSAILEPSNLQNLRSLVLAIAWPVAKRFTRGRNRNS